MSDRRLRHADSAAFRHAMRALSSGVAIIACGEGEAREIERAEIAARIATLSGREHEVLPLFQSGALRVPIAQSFPLQEAAAAYDCFTAGGKLGKVVLTV